MMNVADSVCVAAIIKLDTYAHKQQACEIIEANTSRNQSSSLVGTRVHRKSPNARHSNAMRRNNRQPKPHTHTHTHTHASEAQARTNRSRM